MAGDDESGPIDPKVKLILSAGARDYMTDSTGHLLYSIEQKMRWSKLSRFR